MKNKKLLNEKTLRNKADWPTGPSCNFERAIHNLRDFVRENFAHGAKVEFYPYTPGNEDWELFVILPTTVTVPLPNGEEIQVRGNYTKKLDINEPLLPQLEKLQEVYTETLGSGRSSFVPANLKANTETLIKGLTQVSELASSDGPDDTKLDAIKETAANCIIESVTGRK